MYGPQCATQNHAPRPCRGQPKKGDLPPCVPPPTPPAREARRRALGPTERGRGPTWNYDLCLSRSPRLNPSLPLCDCRDGRGCPPLLRHSGLLKRDASALRDLMPPAWRCGNPCPPGCMPRPIRVFFLLRPLPGQPRLVRVPSERWFWTGAGLGADPSKKEDFSRASRQGRPIFDDFKKSCPKARFLLSFKSSFTAQGVGAKKIGQSYWAGLWEKPLNWARSGVKPSHM